MKNDTVHIVMSINDITGTYCRNMGVTILSILLNTDSMLCIHVLHDETLTEENKKKLENLVNKYNQKINFYLVSSKIQCLIKNDEILRVSKASLYRLMIPSMFTFEKILYLDTDIIVNLDIIKLWEINIEDYTIAAVLDSETTRKNNKYRSIYNKMGVDLNKYFNAGVILFNLSKLRSFNLDKKCIDFFLQYKNIPHLDQSALNFLLQTECKFIDKKYNMIMNDYVREIDSTLIKSDGIFHFAGVNKPWNGICRNIDKLYWQYLLETPWGKTKELKIYIDLIDFQEKALEDFIDTQTIYSRKIFIKKSIKRIIKEIYSYIRR